MRLVLLIFSVAIVSACTVSAESGEWFRNTPPNEIAAYFTTRCETYGYVAGTDEMRDCVAEEIRVGRAAARQREATYAAAFLVTQ